MQSALRIATLTVLFSLAVGTDSAYSVDTFASNEVVSSSDCCGTGSAHFFSTPKVCRCMKCRIRDRVHLLGLESQLFSGDQPVHMPYETWNVYYYHRPYQFRQADGHRLLPNLDARNRQRERLLDYYEQRTLANRPSVGNVDTLEFSILPGERD